MSSLAELIDQAHSAWLPRAVEPIFGTTDTAVIATTVAEAVERALGAVVEEAIFYEPGVGLVIGVQLSDGRAVVAKVHRASLVTKERLAAVVRVQAVLAARGLPAPLPLAGPLALGDGWLTVEEYRTGETVDGYQSATRREMAVVLHRFVAAARDLVDASDLGSWPGPAILDDLWPEPHDLRFDFAASALGAEWIDDTARAARTTLTSTTPVPFLVGHLDWRVQNLAFRQGRITAIYDWDSLALVSEPALVGASSVIHPVDWRRGLADPLPTMSQLDAFVTDYERARGLPFEPDERSLLSAGQRWTASYGARCQHSDNVLGIFPDVDHALGWPRLLRELLDRG